MKKALICSFIVCSFLALAGDRGRNALPTETAPPRFEFPIHPLDLGQTTAKYLGKSIAELVSELGSQEYTQRALASRELLRRGEDSVPALIEAKKSTDAEVKSRATNALALLTAPIVVDIETYTEQLLQHAEKVAHSQRWAAHCADVQTRLQGRDARAQAFRGKVEDTINAFNGVIALRQTVGSLTRQRADLESRKAAALGKDNILARNIERQIESSQRLYEKMSESLRAAEESFQAKSQELIANLAEVDGGLLTKDFTFRVLRKKLIGLAPDEKLRIEFPLRAGLPLETQRAANFRVVPVQLSGSKASPEAQETFKLRFEPSLTIDLTTLTCTPVLSWGGAIDEKNPEQEYPELDAVRRFFHRKYPN